MILLIHRALSFVVALLKGVLALEHHFLRREVGVNVVMDLGNLALNLLNIFFYVLLCLLLAYLRLAR